MRKTLFNPGVILAALAVGFLAYTAARRLYVAGNLGGAPARQKQLVNAVWNGTDKDAATALAKGADPNRPLESAGRPTPLIEAVRLVNLPLVKLLLDHGAEVNRCDEFGFSALYYAVGSLRRAPSNDQEQEQLLRLLIDHGADPRSRGISEMLAGLAPEDVRVRVCQEALTNARKER